MHEILGNFFMNKSVKVEEFNDFLNLDIDFSAIKYQNFYVG